MNGRGFVRVQRDVFPTFCREHNLALRDQRVLAHLIAEADWQTGVVSNFTLTKCAGELGLGTSSGRRTLSQSLERLRLRGVIQYQPFAGRLPGTVAVPAYRRLTAGDGATVSPRVLRAPARGETTPQEPLAARDARGDAARKARGDAARKARAETPEMPAPPAVLQPEEVPLEVEENLASERGGISANKDWQDHELEGLLEPILEFCRRGGKTGITSRRGVLAALAPYSRAQIQHALAMLMPELRAARSDRFEKPVGLLIAKAKAGTPEYFTVPAPQPVAQSAPDTAPDFALQRQYLAQARGRR